MQIDLEIDEPKLPRICRPPRRLDSGSAPHVFDTPKLYYRHIYITAVDAVMGEITTRFERPALQIYFHIENLLLSAAHGTKSTNSVIAENANVNDVTLQSDNTAAAFPGRDPGGTSFQVKAKSKACSDHETSLHIVLQHFGDDLDEDRLRRQLAMLQDLCKDDTAFTSAANSDQLTVRDIASCLRSLGPHHTMFDQIAILLRLLFVLPVTSATAERTFSSLRRLKTFLRSVMSQERLNSIAMLHVHKDETDKLDLQSVASEFIGRSDNRLVTFGKFQ
jgi:hypothetical protein